MPGASPNMNPICGRSLSLRSEPVVVLLLTPNEVMTWPAEASNPCIRAFRAPEVMTGDWEVFPWDPAMETSSLTTADLDMGSGLELGFWLALSKDSM